MFAGIGGFRSGLTRAGGFRCVGHCEIDKYANASYQAIYEPGKEERYYPDATQIDPADLPDFDLLCGGFPCQAFSNAGRRRGFADARGTLFFEIARLAQAKRPPYLLLENVPGLLSHDKGKTFSVILSALDDLGYHVEWTVLNSKCFGVPQSRRRLFLVGYLGDRCPAEILAFGGNDAENCGKGKPEQLIGGSQGSRVYSTNGTAVTQCSGSGGMGGKTGLYFIDCNPSPQMTDAARCITARQNSGISHHKGEHSAVFVDDAPRAILNPFKEHTRQNGRRIKEPNEPMFTLTVTDRHGIVHRGRIRRLMPVECWKLQGFRKDQFEKVAATGMSDAQLYKQAGNSITVAVVEAIARNLLKFDEEVSSGKYD